MLNIHLKKPSIRWRQIGRQLNTSAKAKVALCLVVVVLLSLLFPRGESFEFSKLQVGMVSDKEIIAPFTFNVLKNDDELEKQRAAARQSVPPILDYDPTVASRQRARLDSLFEWVTRALSNEVPDSSSIASLKKLKLPLFEETIQLLLGREATSKRRHLRMLSQLKQTCNKLLTNIYSLGLLENKQQIVSETTKGVVIIRREGEEKTIALNQIVDVSEAKTMLPEKIRKFLPNSEDRVLKACYEITTAFLSPNLSFNEKKTAQRREQAVASVPLYKRTILANERILASHQVITQEDMDVLKSLAKAKAERELQRSLWRRYLLWFGRTLVSLFSVSILVLYLYCFKKQIYNNNSLLLLLSIMAILPTAIASFVATNPTFMGVYRSEFLVPIALSSMLVTVLLEAEIGIILTFVNVLLVGCVLGYHFQSPFVSGLCGVLSVYLVRDVRHRRQFYRPMIFLPLAYAVIITATDLLRFSSFSAISRGILPGMLNGFLSPVLTIGLLPVFESIFGITTNITLLELSDLNHPLLRDLAIKAPGTYNHSIIVGSLAEAAAEAIGANSLLARVGSYYHDIGKMEKPEYFVENQLKGKNPHDKLSPSMSSLILASHIKEGCELADRYNLPRVIKDIIRQHHGRTVMSYFYHRAQERGDKEEVKTDRFQYPGPRPQTKEAAIVMLADSVEAATRSLPQKTSSRIKETIKEVVQSKLSQSELDESDLTLRDLNKISESFLPILLGIFHVRVEYPKGQTDADSLPKKR
ncbi:MAG: HDIG domain-containing protein [Candidatus Latescibacteria bacterium]|nr:HDIG domain-containing protein [Candidatus Latescibacterota bacterium]